MIIVDTPRGSCIGNNGHGSRARVSKLLVPGSIGRPKPPRPPRLRIGLSASGLPAETPHRDSAEPGLLRAERRTNYVSSSESNAQYSNYPAGGRRRLMRTYANNAHQRRHVALRWAHRCVCSLSALRRLFSPANYTLSIHRSLARLMRARNRAVASPASANGLDYDNDIGKDRRSESWHGAFRL